MPNPSRGGRIARWRPDGGWPRPGCPTTEPPLPGNPPSMSKKKLRPAQAAALPPRRAVPTMLRRAIGALWLASLLWSAGAFAQDPPAVAAAAADSRDALRARIAAAKDEGAVSYWDAVVQPETNEELTTAFRKTYGLPASFA